MAEASSGLERIVAGSLTCSICLETIVTPRALACLHTFCEGCIQSVISGSKKSAFRPITVVCPDCRHTTSLTAYRDTPVDQLAQKLPLNFHIKNIIDGLQEVTGSTVVTDPEDAQDSPDYEHLDVCGEHDPLKIRFHCPKHQALLCKTCKFSHWRCSTVKIESAAAELTENGDTPLGVIEEMKAIRSDLESSVETLLSNVKDLTIQVDGIPASIQSLEERLVRLIRNIHTAIEEKTEEVKENATKKQKGTIAECINWLTVLDTMRDDLQRVYRQGSDVQKFIAVEKTRKRLEHLWNICMGVNESLQCVGVRLALVDVLRGVLLVGEDLLGKVETKTYKPDKGGN